jgi:hypothetical protein
MDDGKQQPASEDCPASACSILADAAVTLEERASQRDTIQERSMRRCVDGFNGLTGHKLSEEDGWLFMVCLKMARARNGRRFHRDDYLDGAAYVALAGECAGKSSETSPPVGATGANRE